MHLYFVESQIPELVEMTSRKRQGFKSVALTMFARKHRWFRWLPVILCAIGAPIGGFAVMMGSQGLRPPKDIVVYSFLFYAGVGLGGFLGGFVGNQFLFRKLRQYLKALIE